MKGFIAIAAGALAAAAFAAWSLAAPTGSAPEAAEQRARPRLPALPAEVRSRGRWQIGVKCDYPPFGYTPRRGGFAGYDVRVGRRFAQLAFGSASRVEFTCTTTANRIPTLQSRRVDIIISTLTWTRAREEIIDYSLPYYGAAGKLLVRNTTRVGRLATWMNGKTITTTPGSIYDTWMRNCFRNTTVRVVTNASLAALAVKNNQADAVMFDDSFLVGIAANDPELRLTNHRFLNVPWGIGIRKGETQMRRWVNAAIVAMKRRDEFWGILRRSVPRRFYRDFRQQVPRPRVNLRYPRNTTPENNCPS